MYLLTNSTDLNIIGKEYPQSHMSKDYPNYSRESIQSIIYDKQVDYKPYLNSFDVKYRAKLTDNISCLANSNALLISEKLLNIFLTSNIDHYQYFEANVIYHKKDYKYYLFFIYGQDYSLVDYQNMKFWGVSSLTYSDTYRSPGEERQGGKKKEIKVETLSQIINWQKLYPDYPNREYEALKLNHSNISTDMIRLPSLISSSYFVSEELKNKIEAAKCTGLDFRTKDWRERPIL
jgi:hypothetical protein